MVARDESRIGRPHRGTPLGSLRTLLRKPMAPFGGPLIEGARICKQHASTRIALGAGRRVAKEAKDKGEIPMPMSPAEFGKLVTDETEKWAKVVKFANISVE